MSVDLDKLLERVTDEQSFIDFVAALSADFSRERALEKATPSSAYQAGALGWEKPSPSTRPATCSTTKRQKFAAHWT